MKTMLRSVSLLALASCALAAQAVTIDFDSSPTYLETYIGTLDIGGLSFTTGFFESVRPDGELSIEGASNGTQALVNGFSTLTIARTGGGAFAFGGLDYGQGVYANSTDPLTITLNLASGGVQVFSLTSTRSFQTLTADALVSSVVISPNSGYFVIDNVRFAEVSTVPGPLAALPFALMALKRRKRA